MRSGNPALAENTFINTTGYRVTGEATMTMQGVAFKTFLLLLCVCLSGGWLWMHFIQAGYNTAAVTPWMMAGIIGGLITAVVTAFKKEWAPVTAPLYAVLEGLVLGGLSAVLELSYPGIAVQAAALTFGTLAALLLVYQMGLVRVTESFRMGVMAATGGIFIVYLIAMVLGFFGIQIPGIFGSGIVGIAFSVLVCGIAALNLVLDFDFIEQGERRGAPKYMEWYGAFALMVTLVWLYIEILRLLSKIRER